MKTQTIKINEDTKIIIDKKATLKLGDWFYNQWAKDEDKISNNATRTGIEYSNKFKLYPKIITRIDRIVITKEKTKITFKRTKLS